MSIKSSLKRILLAICLLIGVSGYITYAQELLPHASFQAESFVSSSNIQTANDPAAAGGQFISFNATTTTESRSKYDWPFADTSIWNMPIGSNAQYLPAGFSYANAWNPNGWSRSGQVTIDEEFIGVNPTDPLKTLTVTSAGGGNGERVHVPSTMSWDGDWNGCATFLREDKNSVWQGQPLTLSAGGNPSWTWTIPTNTTPTDLKGDGFYGCHGGSRLSGFGGSIRKGELTSSKPIRHALKLNVFAEKYLSRSNNGFRWPATTADSGYNTAGSGNYYNGSIPDVRMGALVAIKPGTDLSFITSPKLKKIADALTDYGAYIVDNTAWDVYGIPADVTAKDELLIGDINNADYHYQFQTLITKLQVVTNNAQSSIGGGGTPRAPLAPPFSN